MKLGCVMPGESPALFGDALRRLAGSATYRRIVSPRRSPWDDPDGAGAADGSDAQVRRSCGRTIASGCTMTRRVASVR